MNSSDHPLLEKNEKTKIYQMTSDEVIEFDENYVINQAENADY